MTNHLDYCTSAAIRKVQLVPDDAMVHSRLSSCHHLGHSAVLEEAC